ncbi:MAG: hypothetical protein PSU94_16365 [Lacunisphaera sp.]|nr:hypothetical protein [Lacunisphaera sp.]
MIPRTRNLLAAGLAASLAVSLPEARATEQDPAAKPAQADLPQLQLTVDVPPNWRPFLADDLADAFASRVMDVFRRHGYTGEVKFIPIGDPAKDRLLLAIRLINWRIGRTDSAECVFTAVLIAGGKEESLGIFDHTNLAFNRGMGRWGLADALGDVADDALRGLAKKLANDPNVPGFPPPKQ